jgi:hypothetical protein
VPEPDTPLDGLYQVERDAGRGGDLGVEPRCGSLVPLEDVELLEAELKAVGFERGAGH